MCRHQVSTAAAVVCCARVVWLCAHLAQRSWLGAQTLKVGPITSGCLRTLRSDLECLRVCWFGELLLTQVGLTRRNTSLCRQHYKTKNDKSGNSVSIKSYMEGCKLAMPRTRLSRWPRLAAQSSEHQTGQLASKIFSSDARLSWRWTSHYVQDVPCAAVLLAKFSC